MKINIKGIRTSCRTREESEVDLQAEIIETEKGKIFKLYGGPTGYESFYIKDSTAEDFSNDNACWVACIGDIGHRYPRYDRLEISASEMRKVLKGSE